MTEEVKPTEEKVVEQTTEQEQPAAPDLTVQDLSAIKQIIDIASQRGAFKPNEMTVIGTTYNRLEAFLGAIQKQQEAQGE